MYTIESEFFAHTDLCFPHSLLFSISRLDFSSVWLPSLLPTRVHRSPEVRSRFYRRKLVFSRYAVTNNGTLQHLLDAHPLAGTKDSMITTRHRRCRLFPLPISASYSNYIS